MRIFVLNLPRSRHRLKNFYLGFGAEPLITVVDGVDGMEWGEALLSKKGSPEDVSYLRSSIVGGSDLPAKYRWRPDRRGRLESEGLLGKDTFPLLPGEVGCALGHRKMWEEFLLTGDPWGVFMEDDSSPGPLYSSKDNLIQHLLDQVSESPSDMVVFLNGSSGEEFCPSDPSQLILCRGTVCYAMTRKAAILALRACFPLCLPLDVQLYWRLMLGYETYSSFVGYAVPDFEPLSRIRVTGISGVVEHDSVVGFDSDISMNAWK